MNPVNFLKSFVDSDFGKASKSIVSTLSFRNPQDFQDDPQKNQYVVPGFNSVRRIDPDKPYSVFS